MRFTARAGVVLGLFLASGLGAQVPDSALDHHATVAVLSASAVQPFAVAAAPAAGQVKDPMLAGIASFLIPGLGSFYAGNSTHGLIHLGVEVGSYALMIGGATSCDVYDSCSGNSAMVGIGALTMIGNGVWSIFTAVHDAHVANGDQGPTNRPGRVVGSLYISPAVQALGVAQPGMRREKGVQVLSLAF